MKDKIFLDTNLWIYFFSDEIFKQETISNIITNNFENIVVSSQVLCEIFNVLSRKKLKSLSESEKIIKQISDNSRVTDSTSELIISAISIHKKYRYSFWVSLIISAARKSECTLFYSEDKQNSQILEKSLRIINPFR
jgi:predicted nucleic acid-binding protein